MKVRTASLVPGAKAGALGGAVMGVWMMTNSLATDEGLWTPLGYIGHFFVRDETITAPVQVAVGLGIHMIASTVLGASLTALLSTPTRPVAIMRGIAISIIVWAIMQYGVLYFADSTAFQGIEPRPFAVGHIAYGWILGFILGRRAEELATLQAWGT